MSGRRYDNRIIFRNSSATHQESFTGRDINFINQYNTPEFKDLSPADIASLNSRNHIWKTGDKFFKLSYESYGTTKLWWIIPWFNQKPLESDFKHGDIVHIPFPLSDVLNLFYSSNV
tara:strand:+ start:1958 stop:2308 length:351 start_codon:yes stop_codon:yes gene_type:complete